ncbi:MAG: helix-turn-helix transcriptional regulator [Candidatus Merdivicinus sp.]
MEYGHHTGTEGWHVTEKLACGYVRVYDVEQGEVSCHSKTGSFLLQPGRIYLFPSAAPYSLCQSPDNWFRCTYLHLDIAPSLLREVVELREDALTRHLFDTIREAAIAKEDRVMPPLAAALEEYCREKQIFVIPENEIMQALSAMTADIAKNWKISDLSRIAGYSDPYFIRRFHAEMGVSPHQYLIARRMKEAVRLLWGGYSVTDVARQIGYPELKAFSRAFRQWYGITPSQYRESGRLVP